MELNTVGLNRGNPFQWVGDLLVTSCMKESKLCFVEY